MDSEKRKITGVIFYDTWRIPAEMLDAERFGELVKAFLLWAWDGEEPTELGETQKMFFNIAKKQAKTDFEKYDAIVEKRREAGKKHTGNQYTKMEQNGTNGTNVPKMEQMEQNGTNGTNNKYNNINNNNDINISSNKIEDSISNADKSATKKSIEERQKEFYNELIPYVDTYGKNMIRSFYNYWSQVNKGGKKMLWEMQKAFELPKRLSTWHGKEHTSGTNNNGGGEQLYRNNEERMEQAKREGWI